MQLNVIGRENKNYYCSLYSILIWTSLNHSCFKNFNILSVIQEGFLKRGPQSLYTQLKRLVDTAAQSSKQYNFLQMSQEQIHEMNIHGLKLLTRCQRLAAVHHRQFLYSLPPPPTCYYGLETKLFKNYSKYAVWPTGNMWSYSVVHQLFRHWEYRRIHQHHNRR